MESANNQSSSASQPDVPLELVEPEWGSRLASIIVDLEKLRTKRLSGPARPYIFFQLKGIFQMLESLGSARIEGNRTTLAEVVDRYIEHDAKETSDEKMREIKNIESALAFIEEHVDAGAALNRAFLSELHKRLVDGLTPPPVGEGSRYPGVLRPINVTIQRSIHRPPDVLKVPEHFDDLLEFVNRSVEPKNDLLITAIAHHRMAWIHPYDNGNGRMVRLLTYAMLIKQRFQVKHGRILNPTAIFCMDRDRYYDMLSRADSGKREDVLAWCEYVLEGLRVEIEKIDRLLDVRYLLDRLLLPTLDYALAQAHITPKENDILRAVAKHERMAVKASDLEDVIGTELPVQRSRIIRRLRDKKMLIPLKENGRIYTIGFRSNYLLRGVIRALEREGFISSALNAA